MEFLELINKCLLELNYRQVSAFSELIKNDHKRIMEILNIINREICSSDCWNFLLRKKEIEIPEQTIMIENPINGRILHLFINGKKYKFKGDFEKFLFGQACPQTYSVCASNLLLPKFKEPVKAEIVYYTQDCVVDADGEEKTSMTLENDKTLIPMPYVEQLLVYGTCLRLKGNPTYIKFNYWLSMYKEALLNLKSKMAVDAKDAPTVRLSRN